MNNQYSLYTLAILWILWCSMHSLLISRTVTREMKELLEKRFGYYRLGYNVFSLVTLILLVSYQQRFAGKVIFAWPGPWIILKIVMFFAAFALFYGGYRVFDMQYVIGLKQLHQMRQGGKPQPMEFSTTGILEYVRHPWYSGAILFILAFGPVTDVSLVSKTILTAYIFIGAFLEEKKLVHEIGEPYIAYRQRVPMLVPWKGRKSENNGHDS